MQAQILAIIRPGLTLNTMPLPWTTTSSRNNNKPTMNIHTLKLWKHIKCCRYSNFWLSIALLLLLPLYSVQQLLFPLFLWHCRCPTRNCWCRQRKICHGSSHSLCLFTPHFNAVTMWWARPHFPQFWTSLVFKATLTTNKNYITTEWKYLSLREHKI